MVDDQRFQRLEQQVASLSVGQERMLKQMNDFFQAMHAQEEASSLNQRDCRPSGGGGTSMGSVQPKPVRLEFSRYDGVEDPTMWLCRAEQYFEFQKTAKDEKVHLASYHMEGDAQVWIQQKKVLRPQMEWDELKIELMLRFGTATYEDGFGELCKLK